MTAKKKVLNKFMATIPILIAAVALVAIGAPASAQDFTMGNFDHVGSRNIPRTGELNKHDVVTYGFKQKWFASTMGSVASTAVTKKNTVIVGTMSGYVQAFDKRDGKPLWTTCIEPAGCPQSFPFGGIVANPAVKGNMVYIGTLSGSMVALKVKTGQIAWTHTPNLNPPQGFPVDSIWGGAIVVRDMVIYGLSPADQFGPLPDGSYARGGMIAVKKGSGKEVWRTPTVTDAEFAAGASGAGFWLSAPTYSKELDLIYIGTGQDRNPGMTGPPDFDPDPLDSSAGSDSVFAFRASDGTIAWQTQVRDTDSWNTNIPFNPVEPVDTDISNSPSVFKHRGRSYVAAGDKRGIFWVFDAVTGTIVNNGGKGLDMFGSPPGIPMDSNLPGPGLRGGFNLDSGYFRKGGKVYHFSTYADLGEGFRVMVPGDPLYDPVTYPDGECSVAPGPTRPGCPEDPFGNLVVIDAMGQNVVCKYTTPVGQNEELFTTFHVDGLLIARGAGKFGPAFVIPSLYVIDASNCDLLRKQEAPNALGGLLLGAALSIADGTIYFGGGYFGVSGLTAMVVAKPDPGHGPR